jgi:O-antigen/teichoic acid export membrane protein
VDLYRRSVLYLLVFIAPLTLAIAFASQEILVLWLGHGFSEKSADLLKVFSCGVLINSIAQIPFSLLQGGGRAAVTAKIHLIEFPAYCLLLYIGCTYFGLLGASLVWLLRIAFDTYLMFYCSLNLLSFKFSDIFNFKTSGLMGLIATAFVFSFYPSMPFRLAAFLILMVVIALYTWCSVLTNEDRLFILAKLKLSGCARRTDQ